MAEFRKLPTPVLDAIADRAAARIAGTFRAESLGGVGDTIETSETVEVWILNRSRLLEATDSLLQVAERTGRWHHQLRRVNKQNDSKTVIGFARTSTLGPDPNDWCVQEVVESNIANRIDLTMKWIDQHDRTNALARLLNIPFLYTMAFWLVDEDNVAERIVVISCPPELQLDRQRFYSAKEFINILLETSPMRGIV